MTVALVVREKRGVGYCVGLFRGRVLDGDGMKLETGRNEESLSEIELVGGDEDVETCPREVLFSISL